MTGERYTSPGSSRSGARKKRRYHYEDSNPEPEREPERAFESDIDSRSSFTSSRSSLTATTSAPPRRSRHHTGDDRHCAVSRSSRRSTHSASHSNHHHHSHRHHRRALLPAPDEKSEYPGNTAVAIREIDPVQTVARRRRWDVSSSEEDSDQEQVYDHRPRPVSWRTRDRQPARRSSRRRAHNTSDQGVLVAAAMVLVGLFVCFAEAN